MKIVTAFFTCAFVLLTTSLYSQDDNNDVNIGSKILHQDGDNKNSFKNGKYSYEKIMAFENIKKEEIYEKVKKWIQVNYKISNDNIIYDDVNKESLTFNYAIRASKNKKVLPIADVSFKMILSIKDSKLRIQAQDFEFSGIDNGKKIYAGPFHDLRPIYRFIQKDIYEEFDEVFKGLIEGLTIKAFGAKETGW